MKQACCLVLSLLLCASQLMAQDLRPPAVPLVTHDPYLSVWSTTNELPEQWPRHWTGTIHAIGAIVRIDGRPYRLMGQTPADQPTLTQKSVRVLPTRTIYVFEADKVELTLTFFTPALPHNLDVLARPITYINLAARSTDGNARAVSAYLDLTAEWAVNDVRQPVTWSRAAEGDLAILKVGTVAQPVLAKKGDNLRIDWGYLHLAVPKQEGKAATVIGPADGMRRSFANDGSLTGKDDEDKPRPANQDWPALAATLDFGKVAGKEASRRVMVGYDDEYSIEYMTKKLRPYWRRNNATLAALLQTADKEYAGLLQQCTKYDDELMKDLAAAGGEK
jgi:hypothetical protein